MRLQLTAALTALVVSGVSFVDAALPVRRKTYASEEPQHANDLDDYDEDEYWSNAFSAILSQDPSAQHQHRQERPINPDDWRRYVRELDDLPDGSSGGESFSSLISSAPNNAVGESADGANNRRRSRFHIDDVPSLSDTAAGRRILQQQAVTLDDLLGPITINGPPPPPGANDADGINRAKVPPAVPGGYGGYKKEDDPMYRWGQGDAEPPGYDNAADGPGALAKKKVTHRILHVFFVACFRIFGTSLPYCRRTRA